jgi:hypothetical protein
MKQFCKLNTNKKMHHSRFLPFWQIDAVKVQSELRTGASLTFDEAPTSDGEL